MTEMTAPALALWSDDPAPTDLLSFDAIAATVADALLDPALDPVALGVSGPWGSGKTTVLGLVENELGRRAKDGHEVLVIKTEPWRYDPTTGAKESLIGEVLAALSVEVEKSETKVEGAKEKAKQLVARLAKRIDWAKAIKLAAKTSLAFQIPSIDDIVNLVKPADGNEGEQEDRGLEAFRSEFRELMESPALAHLQAVAVLVDDLDRCLPETVIETLEAIRLFLAVPKMSFVIAADEDRVAAAIRTRFGSQDVAQAQDAEEPAKLYLHKIVQTTIPLPTLSRFDTQAFLLLLQLESAIDAPRLAKVIEECANVRRTGGSLDDLTELDDMTEQLAFASRLTPILYEKLRGNPRRIKRFLNDLRVRQTIAARRGIELDPAVIAKLMVLEVLLPEEFSNVLRWLAEGNMRDQLALLAVAAGRPGSPSPSETEGDDAKNGSKVANGETPANGADEPGDFPDALVRWAKLPPPLEDIDLAPYLYLAASFSGVTLLDESLPERVRDIAANLLSSSRADRQAVTNEDLDALSTPDAEAVLLHVGRTIRDQPNAQKTGVTAILRIARRRSDSVRAAEKALLMLPPQDVSIGTPLLFAADDPAALFEVLGGWKQQASTQQVKAAIDEALKLRGGS
jgi:KAP-like P-loop domain-containing protein